MTLSTGETKRPVVAEPGAARGAWIKGSDGTWLCLSCGDTDDQARANTALIVRAVNAHEALVSALEAICEEQRHPSPAYEAAQKLLASLE